MSIVYDSHDSRFPLRTPAREAGLLHTATCCIRGHPCSHTALKCVNCGGPHEAHAMSCPFRPEMVPEKEENEEEMADT